MKNFKIAILLFLSLTILTGVIYPFLITAAAQIFFREQANGSLLKSSQGEIVGSSLIAQKFQDRKYFWPRPSAIDYNPLPSGGSNLAVGSIALQKILESKPKNMPADLIFASGSGLDPEISIAAAMFQVERISKSRKFKPKQQQELKKLIGKLKEKRDLGILGEPRINVLKLNLALDKIQL